jgi:hypothetical protein
MANITTNKDIDYIVKDFNSTVDGLITFATVNYGSGTSANRLWTNFNADSFSRTWLEIVAYVSDVLFFYFDSQATQAYLQTANIRSSVELIAHQFGYTPASATSASGKATFTVTGPVTIPRGFKVQASNGEQFYVVNPVNAISAGDIDADVLQGEIVQEQFVAEGLQAEEFGLRGPNVIRDLDNLNPADISPQVTVNGNSYTLVDSFIRSNGTDTPAVYDSLGNVIGGGGRVFTLDTRPDGTPYITFGDGIFGRKLQSGETVTINYRTGGGSAGNIAEDSLVTLIDSSPQVSAVTNNAEFSGGADEQSIEQLRELIPASLRTLERAVAEQDYSDILVANFSEVFAASTEANTQDPGVDLNIYVVPQGIGIPQISDNQLLKNKLTNFIDRRKTVTVQFQILDAFGIDALITLEVFISDTASKSTVSEAIKTAIQDFFDLDTGGADGFGINFAEQILLKDIANTIEDIPGIERFEIKRLSYRPRIDARIIGLVTEYNYSDVTIFPNVSESEWLLAASGSVTRTAGTVLFSNVALTGFTYTSLTGELAYAFPVDLSLVAPGDQFRDGANIDFAILSVDTVNSTLTLSTGLTVNNTVANANHGSIRSGGTSYEALKVFKKLLVEATNLSVDSITDNNLDLSVVKSTATALSARVLLDNSKVYIPGQYATGDYYLVDANGNIWEIDFNDSNTLKTSISAVNDASVTTVASGDYKIVTKMTGRQITFQGSIFNIQFNSDNTLYSIGAQFSQIGTIGDSFAISTLQSNLGNAGIALDLVSYNAGTGVVRLNSSPDLLGVNSEYVLIDSDGQIFNIVGVDNEPKPAVYYDSSNFNSGFILQDSGLGSQIGQGFEVPATDVYAIVSFYLKREGNIVGNLVAKIVDDDGSGLPDLGSVVAVSDPVVVTDISDTGYEKVVFSFTTPPTLTIATPYHVVLGSDPAYAASEQSAVTVFDNTGLIGFTYNSLSGLIQYASAVNLSAVQPGHFFKDSAGTLFQVQAVDDPANSLTLAPSLTVDTTLPNSTDDGSVIIYDRILVGIDDTTPTYADGKFSRFDGSLWSDDVSGPSPSGTAEDAIFSVEGTKSVTVQSNLTPAMGPGATLSTRYYDDNNEISFVLGISSGSITSATDANALGKGTVASVPNRPVDNFTFRTSRYADDVVNLRLNEIPQIKESDIDIQILGGVD